MSSFINAKNTMEEILESKKSLIKKAGNTVASVLERMNSDGVSDVNAICKDLDKLMSGFTDEEKIQITKIALAKLVVNL